MEKLKISQHSIFEYQVKKDIQISEYKISIKGFIDCIDYEYKNIYEFKCVSELKQENII